MFRRFLVLLSLFFFAISPAIAADNLLKDKMEAIDKGSNQEAWLDEALNSNIVSAIKTLVGKIEFNSDGTVNTSWIPSGAIGATTNLIGQVYQPPISGVDYIASTLNDFIGKPAYAQSGVGFQRLLPLIGIWRQFRNLVFILSSIVFVAIGLMIILRVKISPQAVISLQSSVPNLITTLILVTFSYAIAGLLIDLSYLIQAIGAQLIMPSAIFTSNIMDFLNKIPIIGWVIPDVNYLNPNMGTFLGTLLLPFVATVSLGFTISFIIVAILSSPFNTGTTVGGMISTGVVGGTLGSVLSILVLLIMLILMFIWLIKFTIGLFKCYGTIIFKIVISPLEIGIGAIPNMKMGFGTWITDLIANLSVFPISYLVMLLSTNIIIRIAFGEVTSIPSNFINSLLNLNATNLTSSTLWVPNMLQTDNTSPVVGSMIAIGGIGISTLALLAKLPELIPQIIFSLKPSPWGQAIGDALSSKQLQQMPFYNETNAYVKAGAGEIIHEAGRKIATAAGPGHPVVQSFGHGVQDFGGQIRNQNRKP